MPSARRAPTKKQLAIIKRHAAEMAKHFKRDKWPLDMHTAVADLVMDLTGIDVTYALLTALSKKLSIEVNFSSKENTVIQPIPKAKPGKLAFSINKRTLSDVATPKPARKTKR